MAGGRKRITAAEAKKRAAYKNRGNAAAAAAEKKGSAVGNYLGTSVDTARRTAEFDKTESQRLRENSAAKVAKNQALTAAGRRTSGRAASRANDLKRIHGRTDEQKIASLASGDRNKRLIRDAALAVAPGGAVGAATAKVGYAKKAYTGAKHAITAASKLGKGSIKKGVQKGAAALANRARTAGAKKLAKAAGTKSLALAKYKAKVTAKSKLNAAAGGKA